MSAYETIGSINDSNENDVMIEQDHDYETEGNNNKNDNSANSVKFKNKSKFRSLNKLFKSFTYQTHDTCPTCKGQGKIQKDQSNELIALIPLSDKRLKPPRIWVWILATVIVCFLISTLLTYLLAPRELNLTSNLTYLNAINLTKISNNDNETIGIKILFKDSFFIQNNNYFSINLKTIELKINRNSLSIVPQITYKNDLVINARTKQLIDIYVYYSIYTNDDPYANFCMSGLIKNLFSLIETTITFSTLWSSNYQTHLSTMQYISCNENFKTH